MSLSVSHLSSHTQEGSGEALTNSFHLFLLNKNNKSSSTVFRAVLLQG